jgi:hypothetical protein
VLIYDEGGMDKLAFPLGGNRQVAAFASARFAAPWIGIPADSKLNLDLVMGYFQCFNRITFQENIRNRKVVNPHGWGAGTVYENFDTRHPIKVTAAPASVVRH